MRELGWLAQRTDIATLLKVSMYDATPPQCFLPVGGAATDSPFLIYLATTKTELPPAFISSSLIHLLSLMPLARLWVSNLSLSISNPAMSRHVNWMLHTWAL